MAVIFRNKYAPNDVRSSSHVRSLETSENGFLEVVDKVPLSFWRMWVEWKVRKSNHWGLYIDETSFTDRIKLTPVFCHFCSCWNSKWVKISNVWIVLQCFHLSQIDSAMKKDEWMRYRLFLTTCKKIQKMIACMNQNVSFLYQNFLSLPIEMKRLKLSFYIFLFRFFSRKFRMWEFSREEMPSVWTLFHGILSQQKSFEMNWLLISSMYNMKKIILFIFSLVPKILEFWVFNYIAIS